MDILPKSRLETNTNMWLHSFFIARIEKVNFTSPHHMFSLIVAELMKQYKMSS